MNFSAVQNIVNSLLESMDFVNFFGGYPLDKDTLDKFLALQSQLKREFDALDIETEFMNSDSTEAGFYLKKRCNNNLPNSNLSNKQKTQPSHRKRKS